MAFALWPKKTPTDVPAGWVVWVVCKLSAGGKGGGTLHGWKTANGAEADGRLHRAVREVLPGLARKNSQRC